MGLGSFRKIHLDFHTSPLIKDIGSEFNAEDFVGTLKNGYVDAVVIFGKCCHGFSYYPTLSGVRHPYLKQDLLGEMVEACNQHNIKTSVYYGVGWEVESWERHPDWRQKNEDGSDYFLPSVPPLMENPYWKTVCINSPYVEQLVKPQVKEILDQYPTQGIWFDMVLTSGGKCYCRHCKEKMLRLGLSPEKEEDVRYFSENISPKMFMEEMTAFVHSIRQDIELDYNNQVRIGAREVVPYMTNFEIEALPHGWGYLYFPLFARYIRTLGVSFNGITARFHKDWGDFGGLKSPIQLKYEVATMIANGAQCSIGDQLHPRGRLEQTAYRVIGEAYKEVWLREPWCRDAVSKAQIGILADRASTPMGVGQPSDALWGATKMLLETHHQFDIIDDQAEFTNYELIILPENEQLSPSVRTKLKHYVESGGRILEVYGDIASETGKDWARGIFGINFARKSPYSVNYLRMKEELLQTLLPYDYVVYGNFQEIDIFSGTDVLSETVNPYFERNQDHWISHLHAPADRLSPYPSVVKRGNHIYIAAPLFSCYFKAGNTVFRSVIENALNLILPDKWIKTNASSTVEVTLTEQGQRKIVHLVNYHHQLRGLAPEVIEEIPPRFEVEVQLKLDRKPSSVLLVPEEKILPFEFHNGYVSFVVPKLDVHQLIVIE